MATPLPPALSSLETRLGLPVDTLSGEDKARAEAALADAATLIQAEVAPPTAATWSAACPAVVLLVALKAARREFENPQGYSTESLGDHAVGITETSGVYLTAREVAQVRRAATGRRATQVGTTRTPSAYSNAAATHSAWA